MKASYSRVIPAKAKELVSYDDRKPVSVTTRNQDRMVSLSEYAAIRLLLSTFHFECLAVPDSVLLSRYDDTGRERMI